jgi:hypothetical protein
MGPRCSPRPPCRFLVRAAPTRALWVTGRGAIRVVMLVVAGGVPRPRSACHGGRRHGPQGNPRPPSPAQHRPQPGLLRRPPDGLGHPGPRTGDSGWSPSSSPCSPGRSCATTRPTPPQATWSGPRCGHRLERSRSATRTPRSWASGSPSWPDPTPPGSWGSTSCSTTTTRPAPTGTCSSWGLPPPGRARASARPCWPRCWRAVTARACAPTWTPPANATGGCTSATASPPRGRSPRPGATLWPMWRHPASER